MKGACLVPLFLLSISCDCTNISDSLLSSYLLHEKEVESREIETIYAEGEHHVLQHRARHLKSSTSTTSTHGCTMSSCLGINVLSSIKKDFKPWIDKGGITARDIDAAERKLQKVDGYIRVSILDGEVYASHLAHSWGTRDGVFLVTILEMLKENPNSLPKNVEFVLSTMDRSQLETSSKTGDTIPFAISFATSPGFLDVPIPDPSFWAWPEMLIPPYWEIMHSDKILSWEEKSMRAFWRGGTARNSGLRETLIHCGKDSRHRGKGVTFDLKNAVRNWPKTWAGPMDTCQYKLAVFAQGYGFTSAKERLLACGSVPIFLERDKMDTYFGRWLVEDKHFKRLHPDTMCADLDDVIDWVLKNDHEAKKMGEVSRQFAEGFFNKDMLNGYVAAVLAETASLQKHTPSTRGMDKISLKTIGHKFDAASMHAGDKGATKDGQKGGPLDAAIAALEGKPCPEERCAKCCFRSPKAVAESGQDVEAEASEGSWWRRHKNSSFAHWRVQKAKEEGGLLYEEASKESQDENTMLENAKEQYLGPRIHHHRHDHHGGSLVTKKTASEDEVSSPNKGGGGGGGGVKHWKGGGHKKGQEEQEIDPPSIDTPVVAKQAGAKAYWKTKLEKHKREKGLEV